MASRELKYHEARYSVVSFKSIKQVARGHNGRLTVCSDSSQPSPLPMDCLRQRLCEGSLQESYDDRNTKSTLKSFCLPRLYLPLMSVNIAVPGLSTCRL
jgi:hypothetical protein